MRRIMALGTHTLFANKHAVRHRQWNSFASHRKLLTLPLALLITLIIASPFAQALSTNYQWHKSPMTGVTGDQSYWYSTAVSADGSKIALAAEYTSSIYTSADSGATWTERTNAGSRTWTAIASSTDGTRLIATASAGYIYTSADSGATWTERTNAGSHYWTAAASSADGAKLIATTNSNDIYTSSDSGATWTAHTVAGAGNWHTVAGSSDGNKLIAGIGNPYGTGGAIYTSTDAGVTWTARASAGSRNWQAVASSNDGSKLVAADYNGAIYTSADSGVTWTAQAGAGNRYWTSLASSANGTKLIAAGGWGSSLYTSTDSGVTWTLQASAGVRNWQTVASSADGTKLVAGDWQGSVYSSADSGATWTTHTINGSRHWRSIVSSTDGTRLAAIFDYKSSSIFTSADGGTSWSEHALPATNQFWESLAMSGDGSKLAIGVDSGPIYLSSDYGVTWRKVTNLNTNGGWYGLAISSDGNTIVASDNYGVSPDTNGYVYVSHDGGTTWQEQASLGKRYWGDLNSSTFISTSSDGQTIAVASYYGPGPNNNGGYIYLSHDGGTTWQEQTSLGAKAWTSITVSADGTHLAAATDYNGYIYTSADSGNSWTERTSAGRATWFSITGSADGMKLVAAQGWGGYLYASRDGGATWTQQVTAGLRDWYGVTGSADGTKIATIDYSGSIRLGALIDPTTATLQFATLKSSESDTVAKASIAVDSNTCYTVDAATAKVLGPDHLQSPEPNVSIVGGLAYDIQCAMTGGSTNATITLGTHFTDLSALRIYKQDPVSHALVDITKQITLTNKTVNGISVTTLDYTLVDGGAYDEDHTANGTIVDPLYIGVKGAGTLANTGASWRNGVMVGVAIIALALILGASARRRTTATISRRI